jgi:hypothetical protein
MTRESFDATNELLESITPLQKPMGCKTKNQLYVALILEGAISMKEKLKIHN